MAAFLLAGPASTQAQVQIRCGARDSILTQLYLNYREQPRFIALSATGNVVEVLTSEDGNTWTIISTSPNGLTCVAQTGEFWRPADQRSPSEGS